MPSRPLTEAEAGLIRGYARQIAIARLGATHPRVDILARAIVTAALVFDSPDPIRPTELLQYSPDGWPDRPK